MTYNFLLDRKCLSSLHEIIYQTFLLKAAIVFDLEEKKVVVSSSKQTVVGRQVIELFGTTTSLFNEIIYDIHEPNLFIPFFVKPRLIVIPHTSIMFLGRNDVSVAEFLMRNLFSHILLKRKVNLGIENTGELTSKSKTAQDQLVRMYFWNLKRTFSEPLFESKAKLELIFANLIFNICEYSSLRLQTDAVLIRRLINESQKVYAHGG